MAAHDLEELQTGAISVGAPPNNDNNGAKMAAAIAA